MNRNVETSGHGFRRQLRRHRRVGLATFGLAAIGLLASACGSGSSSGSGVAHIGSSTTAIGHSSSTHSVKPSGLAYALCIRSHGIANFPEPSGNGSTEIQKGRTSPDFNSPKFQSAVKACRSLNPAGAGPTPAEQAKQLAAEVKFSQCMRSHGVSDFPDPSSQGVLNFQGVDGNSPQVIAANKACASKGVGLEGGRTGP
jgi:hypothetical protein